MRVLVLGAGLQGAACAFDLLKTTSGTATLLDNHPYDCPEFLREYDGGRLSRVVMDIRDATAIGELMSRHDAVVSALPYYFNFDAAQLAVQTGVHFADLGGNTELVRKQETLQDEAAAQGVTVVPDCGLAPGMVNILARAAADALDDVDAVRMYVGGLPLYPEPPLNYQIVYSLEGAFDYYTTKSWIVRDGKPEEIEALTEVETVGFPEPLGELEAFHTAGGLSTMPWDLEGKVQVMEYKTLRYPGHAHIMKAVRDLGLLGTDPVNVKGTEVVPRDAFIATVDAHLRKPESPDLVALKVVATGQRGGNPAARVYTLVDHFDDAHGISAMMRATAYSLSITAQMQVDGRIGPPGVRPAYLATPGQAYIDELAARGLEINTEDR